MPWAVTGVCCLAFECSAQSLLLQGMGVLVRASVLRISRKQPSTHNQVGRCSSTLAAHPAGGVCERRLARNSDRDRDGAYDVGVTAETVHRLCDEGHVTEAVEALEFLVHTGRFVTKALLYAVLKKCVVKKDLALGSRVHAFTLRKGYQADTFLCNHILRMYASHGRLQDAMDVFEGVAQPDSFMWSSIISAHVRQGQDTQALQLYHRMRGSGVKPDGHVFVAALQACIRGLDLKSGQQVHADVLASGIKPDLFVCNGLVNMYGKCGRLESAQGVFDGLSKKDVVTWTAMIAGYSQQGMGQKALTLYAAMQQEGFVVPNSVTFVCLLQACASVGALALEKGRQLHAQIRERRQQDDVPVANSLINMYAKCGSLEDAQRVFDGLCQKDVVTWNALIAGYSQQGMGHVALGLYSAMQEEGIVVPDAVTFVCLLHACASVGTLALKKGVQLHEQIKEQRLQADVLIADSLVKMYAKCGSMQDAQREFDGLRNKDVLTWTAMIAGYSQQGMGQEALCLYSDMQEEGVAVPNAVTFVCLLQSCAILGTPALETGVRLHAQIQERGHEADLFVVSSLVNMYAKCGSLESAQRVFDELSAKDVITWNALIAGYSQQRMGQEALHLYSAMQDEGMVLPDSVTFVSLLQACASVGTAALETGKQLHMQIKEQGYHADLFVASSLVNMYVKCGSLEDGQDVFDRLGHKNVVTWNAMIGGYSQQGLGQEALRLYAAMQRDGRVVPDSVTFVCLLQACAGLGNLALETGKQLHAEVNERGLQADLFIADSLVNMYAKCGSMDGAQRVFNATSPKTVVMWTAMIAGYSQHGMGQEALRLYSVMQEEGMAVPSSVTFVSLLQACATVGTAALEEGRSLHRQIREGGHETDVCIASGLVNMYAKCGSLEDAQRVFDSLGQKNVVTWNAIISGYAQQGMGHESLHLFRAMQAEGVTVPDSVTFVSLLQACASVGTLELGTGKQLHALIEGGGHEADVFVASSLVNMYAKCGSLEDAERVFHGTRQKNVVTWNAMIAGYSQEGMVQEALHLYSAMQAEGMAADPVTFVCLLHACVSVGSAALEEGRWLHTRIRQQGLQGDVFVASSVVNMYAKCGNLEDAQKVFATLGQKDVVTWNALISGYSQQGMGQEALRLYSAMQDEGTVVPDSVTFVCLLQACANVAALGVGAQLHSQIVEQGLEADLFVAGSLINMYGKSGSMIDAQQVFDELPERDIVIWNALIAGYTCEGHSKVVFELVQKMQQDGMQPDSITFLSVLTVCSHRGLVKEGREHFEAMSRHHGIVPTENHYTCMVDLLGRAGQVDEALCIVSSMPLLPNAAIWHTLLGACRMWGNVEVGLHAFNEAVKLDNKDPAAYVLMSNIYTSAQMQQGAQRMQARRKRIRAWKQPGQSWWTDREGLVHSFLVGNEKHPQHLAMPG